jgi:hypothetical protein
VSELLDEEERAWFARQYALIGDPPAAPPPRAHPATVAFGVLGWLLEALADTVKGTWAAYRRFHPVAQVLLGFALLFAMMFQAALHG